MSFDYRINGSDKGHDAGVVDAGPFLGMDNLSQEYALKAGFVRDAVNVDFTRAGQARSRDGYALLGALTDPHSLYISRDGTTALCVASGTLNKLNLSTRALTVLMTPTHPAYPMRYVEEGGSIFWSNGEQAGKVKAGALKPLGVPVPAITPTYTVTQTGGALAAGRYLIAYTYIDADGEEGGASRAVLATITGSAGKIVISNIPVTAYGLGIFCTTPNGELLYRQAELAAGVTTYTISTVGQAMGELETRNLSPFPASHLLAVYRGRLYGAVGDRVYWSDPLTPGRCDLYYNRTPPLGGRVTLLAPVADGLFVAAGDRVFFLAGDDPDEWTTRTVAHCAVSEGTQLVVDAALFPSLEMAGGEVAYFFTDAGPAVGLPGGAVRFLADDHVCPSFAATGFSVVREHDGISQILTFFDSPVYPAGRLAVDAAISETRVMAATGN